jgi:hypothetical protein
MLVYNVARLLHSGVGGFFFWGDAMLVKIGDEWFNPNFVSWVGTHESTDEDNGKTRIDYINGDDAIFVSDDWTPDKVAAILNSVLDV